MRRLRAENASLRENAERSLGWRQLALEEHVDQRRLYYQLLKKKDLREARTHLIRRPHLAADALWEMHRLSPGHMLYTTNALVEYEREGGKDENGLTIDLFANVHNSMYKHPSGDAPINPLKCFWSDKGACVLPVSDREGAALTPLVLPTIPLARAAMVCFLLAFTSPPPMDSVGIRARSTR